MLLIRNIGFPVDNPAKSWRLSWFSVFRTTPRLGLLFFVLEKKQMEHCFQPNPEECK